MNKSETTLQICDTEGQYHTVDQETLLATAQCYIVRQFQNGETLTSPEKSASYFQVLLGSLEHEVFYAVWLDSKHQVIQHSEMFRGTIDSASVYPREVVKEALACNAAAVIFGHNHPSGNQTPSEADKQITKRIQEALALVDIRLLDHLVIGKGIASFAELGLI